jgi:hypothetical protein
MSSSRNRRGRAKISLGLSLVFAVAAFAYLTLTQTIYHGTVLGALVVAAGYWEYRRTMQDVVAAERLEADAEKNQRRGRE